MEDASFIATVGSVYVATVWSMGNPDLRSALKSRWSLVIDGSKSRFRMHESRRDSMRAWATIVTMVSELYFAFVSCMRLFFPDRFVKPLYQDLQTWCCLAFLAGLRWTCRPNGQMSKYSSRGVTVLFNVSSLLGCLHIPNELLPASAVSRAAHGLFTEDPLFTVLVRCACLPLAVLVHYLREDDSDKLLGCALVVVNEVISCLCMAFTLLEVDAALCKQELAAMDLEKQIQKREVDMKETEKVLRAARRLLSVTCDCCERLTHDWQIVEPSRAILDLLRLKEDASAKLLPFLQFICPEDQQRFAHFAAVSHTTDAPSSLHVRMMSGSGGSLFDAQIFLVNLPGTLENKNESEYLIGIATIQTQEPSQSMVSIPENRPLVASCASFDARSERKPRRSSSVASSESSRRSSSASTVNAEALAQAHQALHAIDHISLLIDLNTVAQGYCIRSAQFLFKESAPLDVLPKLYSWVRQQHQPTVEDWIQEHVNSWYATGSCQSNETCRGIKCRVAGTQVGFLAGELSTQGIACGSGLVPEDDYSLIMKINLRQLHPA
eukprot:s3001_g7.t1